MVAKKQTESLPRRLRISKSPTAVKTQERNRWSLRRLDRL
jgi:hypothetical protein